MLNASRTPHRTLEQIALAVLLVLVGLFVLAHTVVATKVSVLAIGWSALAAGIIAILAAVIRVGHGSFWIGAVSGALSTSFGIVVLLNTGAAAKTLTLVAGAAFLAGGILRLARAIDDQHSRALLVLTGLMSVGLGVFVLSDVASASLSLLGRTIGIQIVLDGLSLLLVGRLRAGLRDRRRRYDTAPA